LSFELGERERSLISFVTFTIGFPETKNMFRSFNQNSQGKCKNPHSFAVTAGKLPETSTGVKPAGNTYENMAFQQRVVALLPGFSMRR
jgi:hypothetical protein